MHHKKNILTFCLISFFCSHLSFAGWNDWKPFPSFGVYGYYKEISLGLSVLFVGVFSLDWLRKRKPSANETSTPRHSKPVTLQKDEKLLGMFRELKETQKSYSSLLEKAQKICNDKKLKEDIFLKNFFSEFSKDIFEPIKKIDQIYKESSLTFLTATEFGQLALEEQTNLESEVTLLKKSIPANPKEQVSSLEEKLNNMNQFLSSHAKHTYNIEFDDNPELGYALQQQHPELYPAYAPIIISYEFKHAEWFPKDFCPSRYPLFIEKVLPFISASNSAEISVDVSECREDQSNCKKIWLQIKDKKLNKKIKKSWNDFFRKREYKNGFLASPQIIPLCKSDIMYGDYLSTERKKEMLTKLTQRKLIKKVSYENFLDIEKAYDHTEVMHNEKKSIEKRYAWLMQ